MRRTHIAVFLCALALVFALPLVARADCVVASSAKVREEPRADAAALATLASGTYVTRDADRASRDGWVHVSVQDTTLPPRQGWVRAELIAENCIRYPDAMEQAAQDGPDAANWYERAAALARSRPELVTALEGWLRKLEEAKDPGAARVRAQLDMLRDPARQARGRRERSLIVAVLAEVDGARVYPLTFAGPELAPIAWSSQWEATSFLLRQLPVGRAFRVISDGPGGVVTIASEPEYDTFQEDREYPMEAYGKLDLAPGEKGRSWVAASGEVGSASRGRPLTAPERKALARLAGSEFEKALVDDHVRKAAARAALPSGMVSGFSKDVDGDGKAELVAVVDFHCAKMALDGHFLLIVRREDDGSYRVVHQDGGTSVPGGEGEWTIQLVGSADLNGDGKEELVVETWGYVSGSIELLIQENGQYRELRVAHWAS